MYLGPDVLFAAVAQILFGFAFLASAVGINANKTEAHWAIIALSMILVFLSARRISPSIADHGDGSTMLWCFVFAFIMAIAACAFHRTRNLGQ